MRQMQIFICQEGLTSVCRSNILNITVGKNKV